MFFSSPKIVWLKTSRAIEKSLRLKFSHHKINALNLYKKSTLKTLVKKLRALNTGYRKNSRALEYTVPEKRA